MFIQTHRSFQIFRPFICTYSLMILILSSIFIFMTGSFGMIRGKAPSITLNTKIKMCLAAAEYKGSYQEYAPLPFAHYER